MKRVRLKPPQQPPVDVEKVARALGAEHVFTLTKGEQADLRAGHTPPRVAEQLRRSRTGR